MSRTLTGGGTGASAGLRKSSFVLLAAALLAVLVAVATAASSAPAASGGAGAAPAPIAPSAPAAPSGRPPVLVDLRCASNPTGGCVDSHRVERGGTARLVGRNLGGARQVIFYGTKGRRDDAWAPVAVSRTGRTTARATVVVPANASNGPIAVADAAGKRSRRWLGILVEGRDFGLGAYRPGAPVPVQVAVSEPRTVFYGGMQQAVFNYRVGGGKATDLRIDLVRLSNGTVVRSWNQPQAQAGAIRRLAWNGGVGGRAIADGRYSFRVSMPGATTASAAAQPPADDAVTLLNHIFPVRGRHDFGSTGARFGAGRTGHTHQGHDVMAACGTPLVAARAGKVVYAGFHSAAGYYVVIDGKGTGIDYAYMHLREPSLVRTGDSVRTGQQLGEVGQTGDATACHLHFEMWSAPGWYKGGRPFDPLPSLKGWDRSS